MDLSDKIKKRDAEFKEKIKKHESAFKDQVKAQDAAFKAQMAEAAKPSGPTGKQKRQELESRDTTNRIRKLESLVPTTTKTTGNKAPGTNVNRPITREDVDLMIRKVTPRPDQKTVFGRPTAEGIVLQAAPPSTATPYDGQFAVSVDPDVANAVLVNPGYAILGGSVIAYAGKVTPGLATTATGYIVAEVQLSGVTVTFSATYPTQPSTGAKVVLAEVTHTGGTLTAIVQEQYGEILLGAGVQYRGQFATTIKAGTSNATVTVAAGRLVAGRGVAAVSAADHTPSGAAGTYYLHAEIYYNAGWVVGYASSTSYPAQSVKNVSGTDYPCLRCIIADLTWSGTAVTAIQQEQFGEIHIAGRWV